MLVGVQRNKRLHGAPGRFRAGVGVWRDAHCKAHQTSNEFVNDLVEIFTADVDDNRCTSASSSGAHPATHGPCLGGSSRKELA